MFPQVSLQPGQSGPEVKKLQEFLINQGIQIPSGATGYFGNETKNAVTQWQQKTGVQAGNDYGYWGPKSIAKATQSAQTNSSPLFNGNQQISNEEALALTKALGATPEQYAQVEKGINALGTTPVETQESVDAKYAAAAAANPAVSTLTKGGSTIEEIMAALATGDLSGITDAQGMPFSVEDQQKALAQGIEDNKLYYEALKQKETTDTEAALAQKQADYQDYLASSKVSFEGDKATLDQNAANQGVLFSGGRAQKEKALASAYETDQATKLRNLGADISSTAQDYQYKYGGDAANSLSKYYTAGGNTYNPNVASGGVKTSTLSSIYNPSTYNYQGTTNVEQKTAAQKRAAGYLWNKGNKLLSTGYSNQY